MQTAPYAAPPCVAVMYNTAMLVEMLLLALFARALYSKDIPDLTDPQNESQPSQVCVIEVAGQKGELTASPSNNNNYNKGNSEDKTSYKL